MLRSIAQNIVCCQLSPTLCPGPKLTLSREGLELTNVFKPQAKVFLCGVVVNNEGPYGLAS